MELPVPYYSQYRDVEDPYWQARACGATCLKMVLDFYASEHAIEIPSLSKLITHGVEIKAHTPAQGWIHQGMVFMAHNHGVPAHHEEFRSLDGGHAKKLVRKGFEKLITTLAEGRPVIVSVEKEFSGTKFAHQIVLVGFEGENKEKLIYHDPEVKDKSGKSRRVEKDEFLRHWRCLAIFVG